MGGNELNGGFLWWQLCSNLLVPNVGHGTALKFWYSWISVSHAGHIETPKDAMEEYRWGWVNFYLMLWTLVRQSCKMGYCSLWIFHRGHGSWPLYHGDETLTNGRYYNGSMPRAIADAYTGYDKDVLKHDNAWAWGHVQGQALLPQAYMKENFSSWVTKCINRKRCCKNMYYLGD